MQDNIITLIITYLLFLYVRAYYLIDLIFFSKVVPVMINYLPLHEDFVENFTVFKCLSYLYEIGNQYMVLLAEPVIKASLVTLSDRRKYCDDGTLISNYKIFLFSIIID